MARGYFCGGGSGGVDCDDATALEADILEGKTAGISGKDEIVSGKMPERGDWSSTELAAGESITIPGGHHSGKGMVTTKSLEKQTPGNLDANKMLLGTYGWSGGKRVDGEIYSQEGIILNPGTTEKTGMVIGKYMLGNITVPAINIPAAYIKKGQRITFPDGSSVVGTFEGYVANANDLYYRGIYNNPMNLENSNMEFRSDCIAFPTLYTYYLHFTNPVNLSAYSKLIVEDARSGVFTTSYIDRQRLCVGSSVKPTAIKSVPTSVSGKSLVFDISSLQGSQYIRLGLYVASNAQIIRIRLE